MGQRNSCIDVRRTTNQVKISRSIAHPANVLQNLRAQSFTSLLPEHFDWEQTPIPLGCRQSHTLQRNTLDIVFEAVQSAPVSVSWCNENIRTISLILNNNETQDKRYKRWLLKQKPQTFDFCPQALFFSG